MTLEQKAAGGIEIITYSSGSLKFITDMTIFMVEWLENNGYETDTCVINLVEKGWEVVAYLKKK